MLSCTFEQPFPFDGTPHVPRVKIQEWDIDISGLYIFHQKKLMAPSVVQCSSTLWRRFATFPPFLLLPLPSVLSFVIVMARQEIEVQENRKKKRGWRFCQSEVGVRQTCQSHWGRRTQYNHGNVFALCCFGFTLIFISSTKFTKKVVIGDAEFLLD